MEKSAENDKEPLRIITTEEIPTLLNIIQITKWPNGIAASNVLKNVMNWSKKRPDKNYLTVYVPKHENYQYATFILLMQYGSYDFYVFTLQESCENLYKGMINTKLIDWTKEILFCAISEYHTETVRSAMKNVNANIHFEIHNQGWFKEKEKSLKDDIVCPSDVYIGQLSEKHTQQINDAWPHRYPGSEKFISTIIEMNYGFGVFVKETDELVAWILKNQLGCIGILQVEEKYKKRGYGSILTEWISKALAEEDMDPVGFVIKTNVPSIALFTKLDFHVLFSVAFMYANHAPHNVPDHYKQS